MRNQHRTRRLITVMLSAALSVALGSEAYAARGPLLRKQTAPSTVTSKPGTGPMVGEPDSGNNGPLPPKDGSYPTGGTMTASARLHAMIQAWLAKHSYRRLP